MPVIRTVFLLLCFRRESGVDMLTSVYGNLAIPTLLPAAVLGKAKSIFSVVFVQYYYIVFRILHEIPFKLILFSHVMKDGCLA